MDRNRSVQRRKEWQRLASGGCHGQAAMPKGVTFTNGETEGRLGVVPRPAGDPALRDRRVGLESPTYGEANGTAANGWAAPLSLLQPSGRAPA